MKVMKILNSPATLFLLACVFYASCSPIYYAPNSLNVPLLEEKGEGDVAVIKGEGKAEMQAAYAVSDHLGLMLNGSFSKPKNDSAGNGGSGYQLEAGAGYFHSIADHFVFEAYGLMGFGGMENHLPSHATSTSQGNIEASLVKYGVQPSFGFKSKFFDAAVSLRLAGLNYFNIAGDLVYDSTSQVQYLNDESFQFLAEPAFTVRAGYQFVKLQAQLGTSLNLTNPDFYQKKGFLTLGLMFLIDK